MIPTAALNTFAMFEPELYALNHLGRTCSFPTMVNAICVHAIAHQSGHVESAEFCREVDYARSCKNILSDVIESLFSRRLSKRKEYVSKECFGLKLRFDKKKQPT